MKGFNKRERIIIGAVFHDCERISLERTAEAKRGEYGGKYKAEQMAKHLADLFLLRKEQILKHGCNLPVKRYAL